MKDVTFIQEALALYGSKLNEDGRIWLPKQKDWSGVRFSVKGKRFYVHNSLGHKLYNGSRSVESVCHFVERFWFWSTI